MPIPSIRPAIAAATNTTAFRTTRAAPPIKTRPILMAGRKAAIAVKPASNAVNPATNPATAVTPSATLARNSLNSGERPLMTDVTFSTATFSNCSILVIGDSTIKPNSSAKSPAAFFSCANAPEAVCANICAAGPVFASRAFIKIASFSVCVPVLNVAFSASLITMP